MKLSAILFQFNYWPVILIIPGLIATIVLGLWANWWRNRRQLSYEVVADTLLVSVQRNDVAITVAGKSVTNARVLVVRLTNSGFQPIKPDEFEKPLRFVFSGARVLGAEKEEFSPPNIQSDISFGDDWVEVKPALLNRKDSISFSAIVEAIDFDIRVDGRIVGVRELLNQNKKAIDARSRLSVLNYVIVIISVGTVVWSLISLGSTLKLIKPKEPAGASLALSDGRVVSTDLTPEFLDSLFDEKTTFESANLIDPHLNKWIVVEGSVHNVIVRNEDNQYLPPSAMVSIKRTGASLAFTEFHKPELIAQVKRLKYGEPISAICQITREKGTTKYDLEHCTLASE